MRKITYFIIVIDNADVDTYILRLPATHLSNKETKRFSNFLLKKYENVFACYEGKLNPERLEIIVE